MDPAFVETVPPAVAAASGVDVVGASVVDCDVGTADEEMMVALEYVNEDTVVAAAVDQMAEHGERKTYR